MTGWSAAAGALAAVGVAAGTLLAAAQRLFAARERRNADSVEDAALALLPHIQCAQCGYPGCRPYAAAVAAGERVDLCLPGGPETAAALQALLGRQAETANLPPPAAQAARIRGAECIGCALCLAACPVDAIAGAPQHLHAVVEAHCTGCELCVPACPVDCIDLVGLGNAAPLPRRAEAAPVCRFQNDVCSSGRVSSQGRDAGGLAGRHILK